MFPFLLPTEKRTPAYESSAGVRITYPDGTKHLFPGGNPPLALALARSVLPDATILDHPKTQIEFGEITDCRFIASEIVKAGVSNGTNTK